MYYRQTCNLGDRFENTHKYCTTFFFSISGYGEFQETFYATSQHGIKPSVINNDVESAFFPLVPSRNFKICLLFIMKLGHFFLLCLPK